MACDRCRKLKVKCDDARPVCNVCRGRRKEAQCTYYGGGGSTKGRPRKDAVLHRPSTYTGLSPAGPPPPFSASSQAYTASVPISSGTSASGGSGLPQVISAPDRNITTDSIERLVEAKVQELLGRSLSRPACSNGGASVGPRAASPLPAVPLEKPLASPEEVWATFRQTCQLQTENEAKSDLCETYTRHLYCQPLPLLNIDSLRATLDTCPGYLFFALYLATGCSIARPDDQPRVPFKTLARTLAQVLASIEVPTLHLVQAHCLLAWSFICVGERSSAQISTETAGMFFDDLNDRVTRRRYRPQDEDDLIRCCQSIFILKSMIVRKDATFQQPLKLPVQLSPPKPVTLTETEQGILQPRDLGIITYTVRLFGIFRRALSFVQSFGTPTQTEHWQADSTYHSIIQDLNDFETTLSQEHRVKRVKFEQRLTEEIDQQRLYWAPWFTMQFLFHAIQALINHPLIHLVEQRKDASFRPPSFSQHTSDEARLHAGWVIHLIRAAYGKEFELHDPFLAFIAATTATVYLFWIFDKDKSAAEDALASFRTCVDFVRSKAEEARHLRVTLARLEILEHSAAGITGGRNPHPRPSAALEVLLPIFEYCRTDPVDQVLDTDGEVPLPVTSEFLTSPNAISAAATPNPNSTAAPEGQTELAQPRDQSVVDDSTFSFGAGEFGNINIFDTSDILNTALLDGSLWPGQL
ncbi:Hypothetical protein D9617_3g017940 [Elsinoe fawcettii]|nr:Hypothetical protein D9617_3g017940 [Elsinoe fawcettii]